MNVRLRSQSSGVSVANDTTISSISSSSSTSSMGSGPVNTEFLQERIKKLESALERSQTAFEEMITDVFTSVPAKATIFESGSIPQPFLKCEKLEVGFGRRFKTSPRVIAWIIIKDPKKTAGARSASPHQGDLSDGFPAYHMEDDFGAEAIKIDPGCIRTFDVDGHHKAGFTISTDVLAAAGTNERKENSVLYWMAWEPQTSHPKITAALKKIYLTGTSLPRQLKSELQTCIEHCGGINATDNIGQTFLHAAACTGNNELVNWLLHKGADIESSDDQGWTPLLGAISSQHEDTASLLLKKGASPLTTCERGMTCLHLLARWPSFTSSQERLARELIAAGADINAKNDAGETPLLHLCRKRENCTLLAQLMIELGARVTIPDLKGWTPLHMAAAGDNVALINMLVGAGARKDAVAKDNCTPLVVAVKKRSEKAIKILSEAGSVHTNDKLLKAIFEYLPPESLHTAMTASRRFRAIAKTISDDKDYWLSTVGIPKDDYIEYTKLRDTMTRRSRYVSADESILLLQRQHQQKQSQITINKLRVRPDSPVPPLDDPLAGAAAAAAGIPPGMGAAAEEEEQPTKFVVAVTGGRASGKSNVITKFCEGTSDPYASYILENKARSAGQAFGELTVMTAAAGKAVEATLLEAPWREKRFKDAEEEEVFQSIWARADGCVVLMDSTKKGEEEHVIKLVREWEESARTSKQKNIVVCASKSDIEHRGFIPNCYETLKFCDSKDIMFVDISCMNDSSIQSAIKYLLLKIFK